MRFKLTPGQLADALQRLPVHECLKISLEAQASRLVQAVQANLAALPGEPHDQPWQQTGALQGSISVTVLDLTAEVGSNDPAAAPQEFGTEHVPPRPFLLPALDSMIDSMVADIGATLQKCLLGEVV